MRTRGRSVSTHRGVVPSVAAAALFSFGVSCGAPGDGLARAGEERCHPPFTLPVRLHHAGGSLEDALLPITRQGEIREVRCDEEPVAVSFDPYGALQRVITIEIPPSGGTW
ncbi:MAG: hypothetical protein VX460_08565 [Planctomycetota bacterium]|nr:hypothetical protein [Planctomycetota bacterium]